MAQWHPLQYSCLENPMDGGAWWAAVHGVAKSRTWLGDFTFTFHFHALEEEMATHSSVLAWRIPGTVGPGGLPSMGSHRVGHDWSDLAAAAAAFHWVYVLHLLYLFICWWTFRLLPCKWNLHGIVNGATVSIGVHVSFRSMFYIRYMSRNGIAGSYGSSIFNFLSKHHSVIQLSWWFSGKESACQCRRRGFSPRVGKIP